MIKAAPKLSFHKLLSVPGHHERSCGSMFCANCVKTLEMCPLCYGDVKGTNAFGPVPRMILNMIGDLRVTCDHCHQEMPRKAFFEWDSCDFLRPYTTLQRWIVQQIPTVVPCIKTATFMQMARPPVEKLARNTLKNVRW